MKKPFDPWTATEEEAKAEEENRTQLRKVLSEELRKHELGSDEWHEIRYKLDPLRIEATKQREEAIKIKQFRNKASKLRELKLLAIIQKVMRLKLIAPDWLTNEYSSRLDPIQLGQKDNFKHWKTGSKAPARAKWAKGIDLRLYAVVEELSEKTKKNGKPLYSKGPDAENSLWKAAAEIIQAEFEDKIPGMTLSAGDAKTRYYAVNDVKKSFSRLSTEAEEFSRQEAEEQRQAEKELRDNEG